MNITDNEGNIICEVARINLQPNDVLVLDFKDTIPHQDNLQIISKSMREMFPNNRTLFLAGGVELKVINGGREDEQRD